MTLSRRDWRMFALLMTGWVSLWAAVVYAALVLVFG
jgi:hypothetical protein